MATAYKCDICGELFEAQIILKVGNKPVTIVEEYLPIP